MRNKTQDSIERRAYTSLDNVRRISQGTYMALDEVDDARKILIGKGRQWDMMMAFVQFRSILNPGRGAARITNFEDIGSTKHRSIPAGEVEATKKQMWQLGNGLCDFNVRWRTGMSVKGNQGFTSSRRVNTEPWVLTSPRLGPPCTLPSPASGCDRRRHALTLRIVMTGRYRGSWHRGC